MKYLTTFSLLILIAGFTLASCNNYPQPDFKLIILKQEWGQLKIDYASEPAQALLKTVDSSDPLFIVRTELIEKYDWNLQTITLTQQGTDQLINALTNLEETDSEEVTKLREMKESLRLRYSVEGVLYLHPFIVQVDAQFKYGGIFLDALSQLPVDFPVARIIISDDKVVIALLPTHIPFVMIDPVDGDGNLRQAVIAGEAKDSLPYGGFFSDWLNGLATSATSKKFRSLMRDESIGVIFEKENQ